MSEPRAFGGWWLDRRASCLVFRLDGRELYDIPLRRCRTSAEVLDWIFQVAGKSWPTDAVIGGLVRALDYYLHPQSTLCSFGHERGPIDAPAIARKRAGR